MSLSPGQVQALQQHLHDALLSLSQSKSFHEFAPRPADPNGDWSGGTFNMRFCERVARYVDWDMPHGAAEILKLQEQEGHTLADLFSATHGHMNCAAAGVGLYIAKARGDLGLVEAFIRWWQREFHLCRLMPGSAASGPWGPNARAKAGNHYIGNNAGRTLAWNYAQHDASEGEQGSMPRTKQLADKGNTGVLALTLLPADLVARLVEVPEKLVLAGELRVATRRSGGSDLHTASNDYVAWLPHGPGGADVANAAGVWDGKPFAQVAVDAEVNARIALCGPPIILPGSSAF